MQEVNEIDAFLERYSKRRDSEDDDKITRWPNHFEPPAPKDVKSLKDTELLRIACIMGEPAIVKLLLDKQKEDGSYVISNQDVDWGFSQLLMTGSGYWPECWTEFFPNHYIKPDESPEGIKNREECFRLIVGEMLVDRTNRRRRVNDNDLVNEIFNAPHHNWNHKEIRSFLLMAGYSKFPANARLINVLADELQNAGFDLSAVNFDPVYTFTVDDNQTPTSRAALPKYNESLKNSQINYEMLEGYLRLHLKMQYEGKENPSLFSGIKSFFGHEKEYFTMKYFFSEKMREFPNVLANAYRNAENDLMRKHPDFDPAKLKKLTNDFEAKFTPEVYKIQEAHQTERFTTALLATILTLGFAAPFVWPWYIYHRVKEPIKATDTTVQAYAKYLERPESIENDRETLAKPTTEAIQERLAKKEPVRKVTDYKGNVLGYETHKVVQPIKDEKNAERIRVFSNAFFSQSKKFNEKIRVAEKELKQESRNRPKF